VKEIACLLPVMSEGGEWGAPPYNVVTCDLATGERGSRAVTRQPAPRLQDVLVNSVPNMSAGASHLEQPTLRNRIPLCSTRSPVWPNSFPLCAEKIIW
jgi:hypothetical protein